MLLNKIVWLSPEPHFFYAKGMLGKRDRLLQVGTQIMQGHKNPLFGKFSKIILISNIMILQVDNHM